MLYGTQYCNNINLKAEFSSLILFSFFEMTGRNERILRDEVFKVNLWKHNNYPLQAWKYTDQNCRRWFLKYNAKHDNITLLDTGQSIV